MAVRTRVVKVDPANPDPAVLAEAGAALAAGQLVAFPTETVYGLGADAFDEGAVARVFQVKGRPPDNPVIVHVASMEEVDRVAMPDAGGLWERLARRFWPGPLTLVLPCRPGVPGVVTAGLDTVAVRMPRHPVALGLIRAAGRPVAAPSANRSGRPSPSRAAHVLADLDGLVEWVLDAGPTQVGLESTVLDLGQRPPTVLRPGGVTLEELREAIGEVGLLATDEGPDAADGGGAEDGRPRSPGVKYRHYAPEAPTVMLEGTSRAVAEAIHRRVAAAAGMRLGLLITGETHQLLMARWGAMPASVTVFCTGSRRHPQAVARHLFEGLRALDQGKPDLILAEGVEPAGIGLAVNNRLRKAAGGRVERCAEPP